MRPHRGHFVPEIAAGCANLIILLQATVNRARAPFRARSDRLVTREDIGANMEYPPPAVVMTGAWLPSLRGAAGSRCRPSGLRMLFEVARDSGFPLIDLYRRRAYPSLPVPRPNVAP